MILCTPENNAIQKLFSITIIIIIMIIYEYCNQIKGQGNRSVPQNGRQTLYEAVVMGNGHITCTQTEDRRREKKKRKREEEKTHPRPVREGFIPVSYTHLRAHET